MEAVTTKARARRKAMRSEPEACSSHIPSAHNKTARQSSEQQSASAYSTKILNSAFGQHCLRRQQLRIALLGFRKEGLKRSPRRRYRLPSLRRLRPVMHRTPRHSCARAYRDRATVKSCAEAPVPLRARESNIPQRGSRIASAHQWDAMSERYACLGACGSPSTTI
jgi:hypothetical protein